MKISEIADVKGGKRLPKGEELASFPTDHPYIRAQDIREGKIIIDDPRFLTIEQHQRLKRYVVATGDVCIVIVGANVGDVGIVPKHLHGANLTENAVKLTNFRDDCVPQYINYCLSAPDAQAQMQQIAGGAAQPKLGIYKVLEVEIPFHPTSTQERIASILSAYDDLIENNTRRIKILEDMAQMLYREWFVNFRFPGHESVRMVESELGPIPEGWRIGRLDEALVLQRGFDLPTAERVSGHVPIFAATGRNGTHNVAKVKGPGVVTGRSGSLGTVMMVFEDFWPLNTALWVKEFRQSNPIHAYFTLSSIDLKGFNSGAAVPTLNRNGVVPCDETRV